MAKKSTNKRSYTKKKKLISETKNKKSDLEMKNCPFSSCRGEVVLYENPWGKYVGCKECGANGPQFSLETANKIVIKAWNKR